MGLANRERLIFHFFECHPKWRIRPSREGAKHGPKKSLGAWWTVNRQARSNFGKHGMANGIEEKWQKI